MFYINNNKIRSMKKISERYVIQKDNSIKRNNTIKGNYRITQVD